MKKTILILAVLVFQVSCVDQNVQEAPKEIPMATEFKPAEGVRKLMGQKLYVPIYSSIYSQFEENLLHLTAILSLRNTSFKEKITILNVDYYDTNGKLIKRYIDKPFTLGVLSTKDFVIAENDLQGGTGANFIVEWSSDKKVSTPLVESVMMGISGTKGFSFSSRSKEIEAH